MTLEPESRAFLRIAEDANPSRMHGNFKPRNTWTSVLKKDIIYNSYALSHNQ